MTQKTVRDRVVTIIVGHMGSCVENVEAAVTPEDLDMDSLDKVELLMAFEEHFDIEIEDPDCLRLKTIDEIVALIEEKL